MDHPGDATIEIDLSEHATQARPRRFLPQGCITSVRARLGHVRDVGRPLGEREVGERRFLPEHTTTPDAPHGGSLRRRLPASKRGVGAAEGCHDLSCAVRLNDRSIVDDRPYRRSHVVSCRAWGSAANQITFSHIPERAGVGPTHFWAVIKRDSSPTVKWMCAMAAALGVEVSELLAPAPHDERKRGGVDRRALLRWILRSREERDQRYDVAVLDVDLEVPRAGIERQRA